MLQAYRRIEPQSVAASPAADTRDDPGCLTLRFFKVLTGDKTMIASVICITREMNGFSSPPMDKDGMSKESMSKKGMSKDGMKKDGMSK